jgi:hypothetical protein
MASAVTSHSRKITISNRPKPMMGPIDGERTTPNASTQLTSNPSSRRLLISFSPTAANGPTRAKPDASGNSSGTTS